MNRTLPQHQENYLTIQMKKKNPLLKYKKNYLTIQMKYFSIFNINMYI